MDVIALPLQGGYIFEFPIPRAAARCAFALGCYATGFQPV